MKRTSLTLSILLILFAGGVWGEKEYFLDLYPKLFDKTITPLDYEKVSDLELIYLKCEAKLSISLDFQGKKEVYAQKTLVMEVAFNNDIWLNRFDNQNSWSALYHYDHQLKTTLDVWAFLASKNEDITKGGISREEDKIIFENEITLPFGAKYDSDGTRIEKDKNKWVIFFDKENLIYPYTYFNNRVVGHKSSKELGITQQEGSGTCEVLFK